jgi:hypothetical protein
VPNDAPFFHWSDIDPDGAWVFRTIEQNIARPLRSHLMAELAETFGRTPDQSVRLQRQAQNNGD